MNEQPQHILTARRRRAVLAVMCIAGALGDRYGRKGILQVGLAVFGVASLAAIFVNDPGWLIGLRAVIGVGAALVMPTTLSIITNVFREEERGRAVGVWAGVAGAGAVVGLVLSGTLLEWFSWSSVFAISVTLAVLASAATARVVPTSRGRRTSLDPVGAALSSLGLFGLVAGIIEAPIRGWLDAFVLAGFAAGAVLLVAFVVFELRRREPMLDPRLFARRGFAALHRPPVPAARARPLADRGRCLDPADGLHARADRAAGAAHRRPARRAPGRRRRPGRDGRRVPDLRVARRGLERLPFGLAALVTGIGLATAPATTAIVSSLPAERQGIASAVNDLTREVGGAFGIAVLGSVLNNGYRDTVAPAAAHLPAPAAGAVRSSVAAASEVASRAGTHGPALLDRAQEAFVSGFETAVIVAACVLFAAGVMVAVVAPPRGEVARARRARHEQGVTTA